jgi:hypothetical protein
VPFLSLVSRTWKLAGSMIWLPACSVTSLMSLMKVGSATSVSPMNHFGVVCGSSQ